MADQNTDSLRKRILETSRELMVEEGYKRLSMRKIASNVGVSATSIYLHFDSKDHLLHALMEEAIDELNAELETAMALSNDPVVRLEELAKAYVSYALDHPREYQIIYLVRSEEMSRYPKEKFRKARKGYELVTETIRECTEQGRCEEEEPRVAAYVFWAQLHGTLSVLQSQRLDVRIDRQKFLDRAVTHVINGFNFRPAEVATIS